MHRFTRRLALWVVFACIICWPFPFSWDQQLLGAPDVDVWNHAWGYWYVYSQLMEGSLPLQTLLVGAPDGGTLYFIDTLGALCALPITHLFGPAVAYNLTLLVRVALAGLSGQMLCETLSRSGKHTLLAGAAVASSPFLLAEMGNGISEVCTLHWVGFSLWAAINALRSCRGRDFVRLGILLGITTTATFYYGFTLGLVLLPWFFGVVVLRFVRKDPRGTKTLFWGLVSVFVAILVLLPHGMAFWESIHSPTRLVMRNATLNDQLLRHNAVDPAIFWTLGEYQSVNLKEIYGEPFLHTGYLRWTVILLAILGIWRSGFRYAVMACWSLVLGLGAFLWWEGDWFTLPNGQLLSLPFEWLRQWMPQIAITHPLRLSVVAQVLFPAMAGVGGGWLLQRVSIRMDKLLFTVFIFGITMEGMHGSVAVWPIPTADATIPSFYENLPEGAVLDLPAEVGTTMKSSQHFWWQTVHHHPIPYTPDVRVGSARDAKLFQHFIAPQGNGERPRPLNDALVQHLKEHYGLVVIHPKMDPITAQAYRVAFEPLLGKPTEEEGCLVWRLSKP